MQSDGKVLAGGAFLTIGGQTRSSIARLDAATGAADSFDPNANGFVFSIAVQSDGKVLAGGQFNTIGGQTRSGIARLDAATGAADSFDPNANGNVRSIAVQSDGKVLVGGQFANIGGQPRSLFARLSNDTAALSALSVTKTTATLARNGSGAQFTRVIFQLSTDNGATYTTLGTATNSRPAFDGKPALESDFAPNAAGYTLTGLNLPDGQNILIRARGFYRTGFQNGSESIEDTVQNVYLTPLQLTAAVSRKTHGGAGDFDDPLPLSGKPGVECRSSGGRTRFVFSFTNTDCQRQRQHQRRHRQRRAAAPPSPATP